MGSRRRTNHTETVKEALQEKGNSTPAQIAEQTGLSVNQVGRALAQMETQGEVAPADEGKAGVTVWGTND
jgi:DNA-binding IclR family transcriptional regulator